MVYTEDWEIQKNTKCQKPEIQISRDNYHWYSNVYFLDFSASLILSELLRVNYWIFYVKFLVFRNFGHTLYST